ncbi:MAG: hypothetical protein CVV27_12205 [Candidatus Melainabacteria bacterium HGW-Melainabacteria-1]|nr:MAG: hypothetical protein CVV27_12205 [Candidatus Melainabacteria bacterium HGW-Melainabacteria-1]
MPDQQDQPDQTAASLDPATVQLQNRLAVAAKLLADVDNIGVSQDSHNIYNLIDFLVYLVDQSYPFIPCPSGCSHCCSDSGLPRTSALEWEHIHRYLREQMPGETLLRVLERNERMHAPQLGHFLAEQQRIENPDTELPLPDFGCRECPFLLDGRCSIYEVRPAICRGFGYFTWRPGPARDSQIFACQMAADTLLDELRQINAPFVALPAWNPVADKIYALNQQLSTGTMATLPLWLMAHSHKGQVLPLNLDPDFGQLNKPAET